MTWRRRSMDLINSVEILCSTLRCFPWSRGPPSPSPSSATAISATRNTRGGSVAAPSSTLKRARRRGSTVAARETSTSPAQAFWGITCWSATRGSVLAIRGKRNKLSCPINLPSYCDDSYPVNKTFGGDIDEIHIEFRTNLRRQVTLIGCNLRIKSLNNFLI